MKIARTPQELAPYASSVLVPTMGGLHPGHLALARLAKEHGDPAANPVVVSVFVNPRQFEEAIDFDRYPRDVESDAAMLEPLGVNCVFAPDAETVYPKDAAPSPVKIPPVANGPGLEDKYRPGHLEGVCQVLWRLFELTKPRYAIFGEKDWQQLQLARAVAAQHAEHSNTPLDIIPAPTHREPDGLAMSSRNRFLPPADRARAAAISAALRAANQHSCPAAAASDMLARMEADDLLVEYAVVRNAATLLDPIPGESARALIAARLGEVRLIDNAAWTPPTILNEPSGQENP